MTVYILIAIVYSTAIFQKPDSGVIQIEFNTIDKCELTKAVIKAKFYTTKIECVEIKK